MSQKKQKDPVCGCMVDPATAQHKCEHNHRHYAFCGQNCANEFKKNPKKYEHKS